MKECNCDLCQSSNYKPVDYIVNIESFDRPRPEGISGLLRVRNEERWVALAIDSCIDALDELIICYQNCTDHTPEILKQKQLQYSDKIKIYHYKPEVYSHNLTPEEFNLAYDLPKDSIHLLANYYNYTLSKASYRYAIKIDADQIIFTDRFTKICESLRHPPAEMTSSQKSAYNLCERLFDTYLESPELAIKMMEQVENRLDIYDLYLSYVCNELSNHNAIVSLSGINISKINSEIYTIGMMVNGTLEPKYYNGSGDLILFPVSSKTFYVPLYNTPNISQAKGDILFNGIVYKQHRIIERFIFAEDKEYYFGGFLWYHTGFYEKQLVADIEIIPLFTLREFYTVGLWELQKRDLWYANGGVYEGLWALFYELDKKTYNNYLEIILTK